MMQPLELDFIAPRRRWLPWAAFALAVLLAAEAGNSYFALQRALAESRRAPDARQLRPASDAGVPEATRRELDAARRVLQELVLPWGALFRAVEEAAGSQAALLSIEPDAGRGLVRITGEARDYPAVIELMARLEATQVLERVHLVNHELRAGEPQRPYHFALVGYWRASP
jgi:hypothetical protein